MVDAAGSNVLFLARMPTNTPSTSQLKRALDLSERIEQLQRELNSLLGGSAPAATSSSAAPAAPGQRGRRRRRGKLSPEARERIAAAQRARWAKAKGQAAPAPAAAAKPGRKRRGKRVVSAEARAKMAEAARRRWAAAKKK